MVARRTWRFFEAFVGAEDNWLPPDNFQEDPVPVIAHRTSPTNIGLLLLATVSAHDLGLRRLAGISRATGTDVCDARKARQVSRPFFQLVRHQNASAAAAAVHFDRRQRQSCRPCIALKQACIELPDAKLFDERIIKGLRTRSTQLPVKSNGWAAFASAPKWSLSASCAMRSKLVGGCCRRVDVESLPSWFSAV